MIKKILKKICIIITLIFIFEVSSTLLLFILGWDIFSINKNGSSTLNISTYLILDNELGWNLQKEFHTPMINIQNETRITSEVHSNLVNRDKIYFIGCSYTFGVGLSDSQTFAWKVQRKLPHYKIVNLGIGGYGTYQSFLKLKDYMIKNKEMPKIVIYGYIENHKHRNIFDPQWYIACVFYNLITFFENISSDQSICFPFVRLNSNKDLYKKTLCFGQRYEPYFSSLKLLFLLYYFFESIFSIQQGDVVLERLLIEMNNYLKTRGIIFLFAHLDGTKDDKAKWEQYCKKFNIEYIGPYKSEIKTDPSLVLTSDPHKHPSDKMTAIYAEAISRKILELLRTHLKTLGQ